MSHAATRKHIQVCAVAQNCLAEAYLQQILRRDRSVDIVSLKQYAGCPQLSRKSVIFVIDQFGFEMPLYDCLKRLRGYCSDAKFLVLDQHKSRDEIVRILIMGAHGYLPHADAPSTLMRAIFFVTANRLWVPPDVLADFLREVNCVLHKDAYARQTTTPRENEILELMRRRLSNKEIANLLEISVSTVKFHVSNVLSKLQVKNRLELRESRVENFWKLQLP